MALQFVLGPSGAGKSHFIYEKIIKESMEYPEQKYLVIVPEQSTLQTQKELVSLHPRRGLLNIDILSFNRLAYRVFSETGGDTLPVLEETGKSLVLQRVIQEKQKELKVLGGTLKQPGAVSQMKSLVSELMQYSVTPGELEEWSDREDLLGLKLKDVSRVYEGFTRYLAEKYLTAEELPALLCGVIGKSRLVGDSTVVLDGFTGFTPAQCQVLKRMFTLCRQVYVTGTLDQREDLYRKDGPQRLFHMTRKMIRKLTETAAEAGTEVLAPLWVLPGETSRFAASPALAFLEQNLFRYSKKVWEGEQQAVSLCAAETPAMEMQYVAGTIRRLIREKGCRFRDFAVVAGSLDDYGKEALRAFSGSGIPCFIDEKKPALANPFVEWIRAAVDMAVQSYSYESVFRYLRCGFSGFSQEDTDRMENYVVALGIHGRKQYEERWVRNYRGQKPEETEELNRLRERFLEETAGFAAGMRERHSTAAGKSRVLYNLMVKLDIQKKLKAQEEAFARQGEAALQKEYAQIYGIVMKFLDKVVEVLGDEPCSLRDYQKILEAGLTEIQVGLIPPASDQVLVGDIERTRLKHIKYLFFVGLNEGLVPKPVSKAGILSEQDRERLQAAGRELSPTAREEMYRQRFYLYLSLTKPSEGLFLSFCKADAGGQPLLPSYLAGVILGLFPALKIRDLAAEQHKTRGLETPAGIQERFLQALHRVLEGGQDPAFGALYHWYGKNPERKRKRSLLLEAAFFENHTSGIGRAAARALYGKVLANSATRLELFSSCACAHFLRYGLNLQERVRYEFTPADMGTVIHQALECFSRKLEKRGLSWRELSDEFRESLADESLEEITGDYGNTILHSSSRGTWQIQRIRRILRRTVWVLQEQIRRGRFDPEGAEIAFSMREGLSALQVALSEDETLLLKGRIDRLDVCREENRLYLRIVDYKTGSTSMDLNLLLEGLQLQLAVYLSAALELEQRKHPDLQAEPAGMYYYRVGDPLIPGTPGESREEIRRKILDALKLDGLSRWEGEILSLLDEELISAGKSSVIPVSFKKDGALSRTSRAAGEEQFLAIQRFTEKKIREIGRAILEGRTEARPYRLEQKTACDYCPYRGICGFDQRLPGFEYRRIRKKSEEEVLKQMREEAE